MILRSRPRCLSLIPFALCSVMGDDSVSLLQQTVESGHLLLPLEPETASLLQQQTGVNKLPVQSNLTELDFGVVGQKVLETFRNKAFVATLHDVVRNTSAAWANYTRIAASTAEWLTANSSTLHTQEQSLAALKSFWVTDESALDTFLTRFIISLSVVQERHPEESAVIDQVLMQLLERYVGAGHPKLAHSFYKMTQDEIYFLVMGCNFTKAQKFFAFDPAVCSNFMDWWPYVNAIKPKLLGQTVPFLQRSIDAFPQIESFVSSRVPGVVPQVMGVLNATLRSAMQMAFSFAPALHVSTAALKTELSVGLGCEMPLLLQERSGAVLRCPLLAACLAFAAVWLAL
mmetsp:Transcript_46340/g.107014  ORF Transcript_46340/g.107014 Transcript_46340/m.107014 type:complete len:344 (-) Transcript_46340:66-1097(-)